MLRRLAVALPFLLAAGSAVSPAQKAPITVYLVRHAEKGPEVPDPSLTDAGRTRAAELARVLADSQVTALFVTEFKRTQETAAPLATATGKKPVKLLARDVDALVEEIRALPAGSKALVVTHSNLVNLIVDKLSGVKITPLTDLDYDKLIVVRVTGKGKGTAVVNHYGDR